MPVALSLTREALRATLRDDPVVPACGAGEVLFDGKQGGHSTRTREEAGDPTRRSESGANAAAMDVPGWDLHPLKGDLANHWSVKVNANWRMTFKFEGEDAILVDYCDYH
jgi:toxin HigB-1